MIRRKLGLAVKWRWTLAVVLGAALFFSSLFARESSEVGMSQERVHEPRPAQRRTRSLVSADPLLDSHGPVENEQGFPGESAATIAANTDETFAASSNAPWWSKLLRHQPGDAPLISNTDAGLLTALSDRRLQPSDLRALEDLIALNRLDGTSSPYDQARSDAGLSATEVGFQVWQDGRLVLLSLGPDLHSTFGYEVAAIPASFEDLDQLRVLALHDNQLTQLPESLSRLARLEQLIAPNNRLTSVPESLGELYSLRKLVLSNNLLQSLPESLGRLTTLDALHLANNPLHALPESLAGLESLRVLDLNLFDAPLQNGQGMQELPTSLAELSALEQLYVAGHPSLCGATGIAGDSIVLSDGSQVQVFGYQSASCVR